MPYPSEATFPGSTLYPGISNGGVKIKWDDPSSRQFEAGIDRGVLFPSPNSPGSLISHNLATNPNLEIDSTGWSPGGSVTPSLNSATPIYGTQSFRTTLTGTSLVRVSSIDINPVDISNPYGIQVTPGETITVSIAIRASQPGRYIPYELFGLDIWDDAENYIGPESMMNDPQGSVDIPTSGIFRIVGSCVIPPNAHTAKIFLRVYPRSGDALSNEVVDYDGLIFNRDGYSGLYYDGSTNPFDPAYDVEWLGSPNRSESIIKYKSPPPVPWNGISSVDENGAEGSVSYYMDGRPFLYFPKPREFSASVKAYTYPEEFNDVMGVVEATDGMYLDSQVGDTFAFSYRTRIGNPTDGLDFGYKIHIVYNATVVMSGVSYNTIGTSVDPIQFDFPIQAVPMPVDGYRATAHIMIDTRNIEPSKLQEIEAMLYGTESSPAYLPSPQEVFDILKYGDTIIITDLGNGLWEAEGASVNVYETDNGDTFEILNVNATDNGDGSYYVSSTP